MFCWDSFVTTAPTLFPSTVPTTSIPTAQPSITGTVAIIELSQSPPANGTLTDDDINDIKDQISDYYGVDEDDVDVTVTYTTSGTIDMELPEGEYDEEALEQSIEDELA